MCLVISPKTAQVVALCRTVTHSVLSHAKHVATRVMSRLARGVASHREMTRRTLRRKNRPRDYASQRTIPVRLSYHIRYIVCCERRFFIVKYMLL